MTQPKTFHDDPNKFDQAIKATVRIRARYGLDKLKKDPKTVLEYCIEMTKLADTGKLTQKEAAYLIAGTMFYESVDSNIDILAVILDAGDLELPDRFIDGDPQARWDRLKLWLQEEMTKIKRRQQLRENPIHRNHGAGTDYSESEDSSIDAKLIEKVTYLPYDKLAEVVLKAGIVFRDTPRRLDLTVCLDEADPDKLREAYNEVVGNLNYMNDYNSSEPTIEEAVLTIRKIIKSRRNSDSTEADAAVAYRIANFYALDNAYVLQAFTDLKHLVDVAAELEIPNGSPSDRDEQWHKIESLLAKLEYNIAQDSK
jgi:hypothetical protein